MRRLLLFLGMHLEEGKRAGWLRPQTPRNPLKRLDPNFYMCVYEMRRKGGVLLGGSAPQTPRNPLKRLDPNFLLARV
jgi:hypothetical protein